MPIHTIAGGGRLQLAVHEYGQPHGKPILLIHGFNQCHLAWSKQLQRSLADEFRLVRPDNRGHGMSEKPTTSEHYTQSERWADDVQAVITELALDKPILVGWSYGGFIINDYLAKYGQDAVGGINYVCAAVLLGVERRRTCLAAPSRTVCQACVPRTWRKTSARCACSCEPSSKNNPPRTNLKVS